MTSAAYIDLVRAKTGTGSDYAVAKLLDISQDAVNHYRTGRRSLDARTASKVAECLGIPIEPVLAVAESERARSPKVRAFWQRRLRMWAASAVVASALIANTVDVRTQYAAKDKTPPGGKKPRTMLVKRRR